MKKIYIITVLILLSGGLLAQAPKKPEKQPKAPKEAVEKPKKETAAKPKKETPAKPKKETAEKPKKETAENPKPENKKEFVIPTGYDRVGTPHAFKKGWCEVERNRKIGFTNESGQEVVPTR
ncbi:MAG: hypothetical protein J5516_01175, partial [Bacteroidales bacterium]|nr:hypothetical protein [Bacteroidales bacterium]